MPCLPITGFLQSSSSALISKFVGMVGQITAMALNQAGTEIACCKCFVDVLTVNLLSAMGNVRHFVELYYPR